MTVQNQIIQDFVSKGYPIDMIDQVAQFCGLVKSNKDMAAEIGEDQSLIPGYLYTYQAICEEDFNHNALQQFESLLKQKYKINHVFNEEDGVPVVDIHIYQNNN